MHNFQIKMKTFYPVIYTHFIYTRRHRFFKSISSISLWYITSLFVATKPPIPQEKCGVLWLFQDLYKTEHTCAYITPTRNPIKKYLRIILLNLNCLFLKFKNSFILQLWILSRGTIHSLTMNTEKYRCKVNYMHKGLRTEGKWPHIDTNAGTTPLPPNKTNP